MFYSLKKDSYFRRYGDIGYIVSPYLSVDVVVDNIGAIFIEQLEYSFRDVDLIAKDLCNVLDVDIQSLKDDLISFYDDLCKGGFVNKSGTPDKFHDDETKKITFRNDSMLERYTNYTEKTSEKFFSEYSIKNPFLATLHIEITSKCNERCVHCYIPHEKKNEEINVNMMMDIVNQCKDMGVLTIVLSGGEPMLHPQFCDFLKYIKDCDINVVVLSNLTLLDDRILSALKYKHTSCVNVSLYSTDEIVHDRITSIQGSQRKTQNNILRLLENNIPVQINCPVVLQNVYDFQEVIKWGHKHECAVMVDHLIMAKNDGTIENLENRISLDILPSVIERIVDNDVQIKNNKKQFANGSMLKRKPNDQVCGVGLTTLSMDCLGNFYPCAGWNKVLCGNIRDSSLKDIWNNSEELLKLRKIRFRDFIQCRDCEDSGFCTLCMCMNSNEDPDGNIFNVPKITCEAARIQHKVVNEYLNKLSKDL